MKKIFSFLMSLIITFTMISCQCSGVNNKQTIEEPIIEVVDSLQIDSLQIDSIVVNTEADSTAVDSTEWVLIE